MNPHRLIHGTLRIEFSNNSLTLGVSMPFFLAERLNGTPPPEDWDDVITAHLFRSQPENESWSAQFNFPGIHDKFQTEGQEGRAGAGQLSKKPRLGKGKKDAAVRGRPGRGIGGRGLRKLPLSYRSKTLSTSNAGKMALSGYVRRTTRKGPVSLVSAKWQ